MRRIEMLFAPAIFFCVFLGMQTLFSKEPKNPAAMPLRIVYKSPKPPDSIQDFIKLYLNHSKGIDIITESQYMNLFKTNMETKMRDLIQSGKFNEKSAKEIGLTPICNLIVLKFYESNENNSLEYKIDSLQWGYNILPAKDTSLTLKTYIPSKTTANNSFEILKEFCDNNINKKILR